MNLFDALHGMIGAILIFSQWLSLAAKEPVSRKGLDSSISQRI